MHGNVWEWCEDAKGDYPAGGGDERAMVGDGGAGRVLRGGSWNGYPWFCRSAYRNNYAPSRRSDGLGFRAARTLR
jgi:formylglycine-generating enzyme required for sulfatase activity